MKKGNTGLYCIAASRFRNLRTRGRNGYNKHMTKDEESIWITKN